MSLTKVEFGLLKTRRNLGEVCRELGIDLPDRDELSVDQCTHCNVWHWEYKLKEDLDENPICSYCETLIGM